MKIEVGKKYNSRSGKVIGPMIGYPETLAYKYCFIEVSGDGRIWDKDGKAFGIDNLLGDDDLLSEFTDSPIQTVEVKTVTHKLVPGVYGRFDVDKSVWSRAEISLRLVDRSGFESSDYNYLNATELRQAAKTFGELADYLDSVQSA